MLIRLAPKGDSSGGVGDSSNQEFQVLDYIYQPYAMGMPF